MKIHYSSNNFGLASLLFLASITTSVANLDFLHPKGKTSAAFAKLHDAEGVEEACISLSDDVEVGFNNYCRSAFCGCAGSCFPLAPDFELFFGCIELQFNENPNCPSEELYYDDSIFEEYYDGSITASEFIGALPPFVQCDICSEYGLLDELTGEGDSMEMIPPTDFCESCSFDYPDVGKCTTDGDGCTRLGGYCKPDCKDSDTHICLEGLCKKSKKKKRRFLEAMENEEQDEFEQEESSAMDVRDLNARKMKKGKKKKGCMCEVPAPTCEYENDASMGEETQTEILYPEDTLVSVDDGMN